MTERERLIEELDKLQDERGYTIRDMIEDCSFIADFIIADRKRIVEPLVKCFDEYTKYVDFINAHAALCRGGIETCKNAGVELWSQYDTSR